MSEVKTKYDPAVWNPRIAGFLGWKASESRDGHDGPAFCYVEGMGRFAPHQSSDQAFMVLDGFENKIVQIRFDSRLITPVWVCDLEVFIGPLGATRTAEVRVLDKTMIGAVYNAICAAVETLTGKDT